MSLKDAPFGYHMLLKITNCPEYLLSLESIKLFTETIVQIVDIKKHESDDMKMQIKKYGIHPQIHGVTCFIPLETSSLIVHCVDDTKTVYVDLFSCKEYDPVRIKLFCRAYFDDSSKIVKDEFIVY